MEMVIGYLQDQHFFEIMLKFLVCIICSGLIGLERGVNGQAAGFRTHVLVCVGACIAMMTGVYITQNISAKSDPARLGAQVVSGIGFLGAGTIVVTRPSRVRGLTTAAGLWASACIGLAIGAGFYAAAVGGTIIVAVTVTLFRYIDRYMYAKSPSMALYVELNDMEHVKDLLENIRTHQMKISSMEVQKPKSGQKGRIGVSLIVKKLNRRDKIDILGVLSQTAGLTFIDDTI